MKRLVHVRPDGSLYVITPAPSAQGENETEDAFFARVIARNKAVGHLPADAVCEIVDDADLPTERKYRAAWRLAGKAIVVDPAKKAEIDARPAPKTVEQRLADLEAARTVR